MLAAHAHAQRTVGQWHEVQLLLSILNCMPPVQEALGPAAVQPTSSAAAPEETVEYGADIELNFLDERYPV